MSSVLKALGLFHMGSNGIMKTIVEIMFEIDNNSLLIILSISNDNRIINYTSYRIEQIFFKYRSNHITKNIFEYRISASDIG